MKRECLQCTGVPLRSTPAYALSPRWGSLVRLALSPRWGSLVRLALSPRWGSLVRLALVAPLGLSPDNRL